MADTTEMAGVSTPSLMIMLEASSTTTSSSVCSVALRSCAPVGCRKGRRAWQALAGALIGWVACCRNSQLRRWC